MINTQFEEEREWKKRKEKKRKAVLGQITFNHNTRTT
jgi:hypothetical protein